MRTVVEIDVVRIEGEVLQRIATKRGWDVHLSRSRRSVCWTMRAFERSETWKLLARDHVMTTSSSISSGQDSNDPEDTSE